MKIMIDAGHGLYTSGKRCPDGSMKEFEFNSAVASYTKSLLSSYENVDVSFAHDPSGKVDVSLTDRVEKANNQKVDAYVSIHANAYGSGFNAANGIETYIYTSKPKEAYTLATKVQSQLLAHTGRSNRGVKTAGFYVLKHTHMTAILVECGFMTNKEEASLLKSDSYRKKCAEGIVKGLEEQYNLKKKTRSKQANKKSDNDYFVFVVNGKRVARYAEANVLEFVEKYKNQGVKTIEIIRD